MLKPDLPIYLLWLNEPPRASTAFTDLIKMSSRAIIDSHSFFDAEEGIRILSAFMQQEPECAISDLNWGRVTPWRELIAQFFDSSEYMPYLSGVHHIEIEHAVTTTSGHIRTKEGDVSPDPIEALLLAGWLKTILNWEVANDNPHNLNDTATGAYTWYITPPIEGTSITTSKASQKEEAVISIRPRLELTLPPGNICLVRLTSDIKHKHAVFSLERRDGTELVFTSVELSEGTQPQRTVQIPTVSNPIELLHDELEIIGRDHLYEDTLHEVTRLLAF